MARSSRYYPPRIGVHRGTWEGDLDGRESPCGWDCERRICESFFFSKLSHEQFHSYTLLLTSVNGFALIRLPFIPLFILSLLYYELLWFSFLPLSLSLCLLSFMYHRRPIWERESLKVSSPLRHFRSVSPDARQTALSRTPRFFRLLTYSQL